MLKKVAAVIVTYNNSAMLGSLLEDLRDQSRQLDEIIVIDNGNTREAEKTVQDKLSRARYLKMPGNAGSAGGYAEGIRLACEQNDAVWLLDDDVAARPDALGQLSVWLACLQETEHVGAVRSWSAEDCPFTGTRRMDSFSWRGTLVTKEAVQAVGLPNRDFFLYGDDLEYSFRMIRRGFSLFWVAASRVVEQRHSDKKGLSSLGIKTELYRDNAKLYYAFRNNVSIFIMYRMRLRLVKVFLYALKLIVLMTLTGQKGITSAAAAIISGIKDGCCGKLGISKRYTV